MATTQSGPGRIVIFEDFLGPEMPVAGTLTSFNFGQFRLVGQGIANTDSGITSSETDPNLNGVVKVIATDEDNHSAGLTTAKCFDVAKMAPIIMETRVQFSDLNTKAFYFGLTDVNDDACILEGENFKAATTVLTLTASDLCGWMWSSELTEDEMWHWIYNGGTTTGVVLSTTNESGVDAVLAEWDILRIEVDPNGTARFLLNGVLEATVEGAVSTTTDLAVLCMVHNLNNTSTTEDFDVDYIYIEANRDWTV